MRLSLGSEQKLCKRKYFQGGRGFFMEESKQKRKNDKIKLTEKSGRRSKNKNKIQLMKLIRSVILVLFNYDIIYY